MFLPSENVHFRNARFEILDIHRRRTHSNARFSDGSPIARPQAKEGVQTHLLLSADRG